MNISQEASRLIQDFFRLHLIERRNVSPRWLEPDLLSWLEAL